jgi:hypothetical protein
MTSVPLTLVMQAAKHQLARPPALLMVTATRSWRLSSATSKIVLEQLGPIDLPTIEGGTGAAALIPIAATRAARGAKHFPQENLPAELSAAIACFCLEGAA